jgi:hypothetical protein
MKVEIEEIDHWIKSLKRQKTEFEVDYEDFDSTGLEMALEKLESAWNEIKKQIHEQKT